MGSTHAVVLKKGVWNNAWLSALTARAPAPGPVDQSEAVVAPTSDPVDKCEVA
eukprot:CAMPEP_0198681998 /NCGR_PEP_ID=MMETSP1468-20131203/7887_2 /TAXON_ID=1461545 /ORGANISM="Mantoniella sp, Strain CCMP1436" /LENGTH=52 /DNA_ID=CAMNT_0044424423 /DNA_START=157 /DNA_END=312 /DNA_ORIENTATION=-